MIDSASYPRLSRIQTPDDLRRFDESELVAVAEELRAYLIESVGKSGGHFAAGLGVIELTVALHYLFNTPVDQLVWDVGHQTYPHKILTGRRDTIHTVKQKDGVAPFPKREESEYDTFGVGHSSTSISAALGMAIARQRQGDTRKAVAVIGDGAMTAGMAFEALAHAGGMDDEPNVLVILNDNNMSISEAVGGLTKMLGRATASRTLNALREGGKKILGDKRNSPPARFVKRWEEQWKGMFVPSTAFEQMGFHYTGPIDGHDLPLLLSTLARLKDAKGPQLLHIMTTKGKGYEPAEDDQIGYHAVGPFDPSKGLPAKGAPKKPTYTDIFSDWLCDAAAAEPLLMGITPAMREGSGLVRFSKEYPERYFDVAIAEQHAVTLAAGMATQGAKPVVAIYSTFLQRAYDQLVHDVAIQDLDVLFAIDRAGVVGPDGATHAGNLDLSFMRCVPNMLIMAPGDEAECRQMLSTGLQYKGPAAVRYPRGTGPGAAIGNDLSTLEIGKAQLRHAGSRIALLAFGATVPAAEQVGRELGLSVVNMRFIKPLDKAMLLELARTHDGFVTIEDNVVAGGAGSGVSELLNAEAVTMPMLHLGLPDGYQHHASREDLLAEAGIDASGIRAALLKRWPKLKDTAAPLSAAS
ncbi:1-deoxy-D-xylulose-5-phosphate synthase [Stenotrophomonas sp. ATCM1_4]|uniref:1-deoxy-D-xylulose-5-phosphate synthase n=1 Tax=Stenotrophomonas capsici TaxID=3110230 RepID=A0ABU5V3D7_9GAMM|nr:MULTISPECIES: 1-deoxy-D-xylulose-5-phosphate synthase [unclassified Stenotrophomonas]MEA5666585.1 1-deoxy-D-xylulose-5-phosphate synthase [Stenotrophomonas sp. MH1]TDB26872.1 1-deoxy-D-xylulose-5-phosphate synthase [Stenotrophomonas sp. ATCM1_4]